MQTLSAMVSDALETCSHSLLEALLPPLTSRVGAGIDRSPKPALLHVQGPGRRTVFFKSGHRRSAAWISGADKVKEILLEGGGNGGVDVGVGSIVKGVVEIVTVEGRWNIKQVVVHLAPKRASHKVAITLHAGLRHGQDCTLQV